MTNPNGKPDTPARLPRSWTPPPPPPPPRHVLARTPLWWRWAVALSLVSYAAIVIAVQVDSPLVTLDWRIKLFRPWHHWPEWQPALEVLVLAGQRGPTAAIVILIMLWRWHRTRDARPLLTLLWALLLLNVSVGAVKYGLGRLGPRQTDDIGSPEMFSGGDIFPSGHTANAVVTWGVLAYLAHRNRRTLAAVAAAAAFGVGMTTVYLGTHWISDVLAGWIAGILVMLALPISTPGINWTHAALRAWWSGRRRTRPRTRTRTWPPPLTGDPGETAPDACLPEQRAGMSSPGRR
ncbi:phosphatase PAP2 family protein [Allostreptomyces psammosilenae]|uniref:Undecaprenyl-diphosphatase n=1 Tax=Allostreptomyces psammosilenae TaxID=1892865 RepID=A0A852ZZY1_9ACTN|nr:phosphatase PAP2 family protein [Allostreptomyces psammosilenae]NYI07933.1 undecaprenyl-diphosphatase [Allostreptomyces psammosilenae]